MTAMTQETITEAPNVVEPERATEVQVSPRTSPVIAVDVNLVEVDTEKDAEALKRATVTTEELGTEPEKTDQYNRYVLSGKGETPKQKVNEVVKDI